jgi:hypothetical protein
MDSHNTADTDAIVNELECAVFEIILPVRDLDVNLVIKTDSGEKTYKFRALPLGFKSTCEKSVLVYGITQVPELKKH